MIWAVRPNTLAVIFLSLCCHAQAGLPWLDGAGFRSAGVQPAVGGKVGFTLMQAKATGVGFTNELTGDLYLTNAVAHNGAGVAVGAAGSVLLIRQRIASVLRQPEQIPDRVVPILRHRLSLTDEQTEQVAAIVRRRYTALEEVRSEFTPRVATELRLLRTEVDAVLTSDQKDRWAIWCQRVEEHLPSTPAQKPD